MMRVCFRLNGTDVEIHVAPDARLSTILRDELGLFATKIACAIGRCGACMVLMDGRAVNACLLMVWQIDGAAIVTAEGMNDWLTALVRQSLADENAFQCGYCAPGVVTSLVALLANRPYASEEDIRTALEGNLCRCTGYHSILRGALRAVEALKSSAPAETIESKTA